MKYCLSPKEIPRAEPDGFPEGSGNISSYTPPLVTIQLQSLPSRPRYPIKTVLSRSSYFIKTVPSRPRYLINISLVYPFKVA